MTPYRQNAIEVHTPWKRNLWRYRWRCFRRWFLKIQKRFWFCPYCGSKVHGARYMCGMLHLHVLRKTIPHELNDSELFFEKMREQQEIFRRQHEKFLEGVDEAREKALEWQREVLEQMNNGREK